MAEDARGRRVEPWSDAACRWSPLGALLRVLHETRGEAFESVEVAYAALALATGGRPEEWSAAPWRTRWHVLGAFERARDCVPEAVLEVADRRARRSAAAT
jgi:hypothetical protein